MAKRRGNGEGNIRKRKDGRWEGRYTAGHDPETGKQIFKNVLGKTQAEVKDKLKKAIIDTQGIDITLSDKYTLAEWMQVWYEHYIKPTIRQNTRDLYESFIRNHIVPNIGEIKLNKLTSLDLQKLYNNLKTSGRVKTNHSKNESGLSNRTVRAVHMLLHACLEKAVNERMILLNPTDGCKIPPKDKKEMKIIPPNKVKRFLMSAKKLIALRCFIWSSRPVFAEVNYLP